MESLLDSMTITLSRPFIIKGESRDTITIREPKLRDRIMFSNDKSGLEERTATMLARPQIWSVRIYMHCLRAITIKWRPRLTNW